MLTSDYDFGYPWWMTWGHLVPFVIFGLLALAGWRLGWRLLWVGIATTVSIWGLTGFLVMQQFFRVGQPLPLPAAFLPSGAGRVLDMGAGSGRASLGVLQGRPKTTVVALDIYDGYWGINDNTPERFRRNAAVVGAADRVEVRVGDMREMPFPDASFDGAISSFVMDHLRRADVPRALGEAARVLRPGGQILVVNLGLDGLMRLALPAIHGHGYFGQEQDTERWRTALTSAGFEDVQVGRQPGAKYLLGRKEG